MVAEIPVQIGKREMHGNTVSRSFVQRVSDALDLKSKFVQWRNAETARGTLGVISYE